MRMSPFFFTGGSAGVILGGFEGWCVSTKEEDITVVGSVKEKFDSKGCGFDDCGPRGRGKGIYKGGWKWGWANWGKETNSSGARRLRILFVFPTNEGIAFNECGNMKGHRGVLWGGDRKR